LKTEVPARRQAQFGLVKLFGTAWGGKRPNVRGVGKKAVQVKEMHVKGGTRGQPRVGFGVWSRGMGPVLRIK